MRSVADDLRRDTAARVRAMTVSERIALALSLGDDDLDRYVRATASSERPVDVVVGKHSWQSRAIDRVVPMGHRIPVVLARDLALLKLYAGGPQDLWDVQELLRQSPPSLEAEVSEDVAALSSQMQRQWLAIRQGDANNL